MQSTNQETLAINIAEATSKLAPLHHARATLAAEGAQIEHNINVDSQALNDAAGALATAQAGHALGEVDANALRLARDAYSAAEKVSMKSSEKAPEVVRLAAAERELARRIVPLEAELVGLRAELAAAQGEARVEAMELELKKRVSIHTLAAGALLKATADALALDAHLLSIGRDQSLGKQAVAHTQVGLFEGQTGPNFGDLMDTARLRVFSEFAK